MRLHVFILFTLGLFAYFPVQAKPQTIDQTSIQKKVETTLHQMKQVEHVFGSVEALWQFTPTNPHRHIARPRNAYSRSHVPAVMSEDFVFFRLTTWFEPEGFTKNTKLLELTFTALDGTKVKLEPSYHLLHKKWVFTRVQENPQP